MLRESWRDVYNTLVKQTSWFRSLCDRTGAALGFESDAPTVCNLHWRIRFNRANGGGPESSACRFKPADEDGVVSASDGLLELEGYPDLSWDFRHAGGANPGFAKGEVIMMIHDFPPHKIFRRSHRPGRGPGETSIVLSADTAVTQRQQPLPHSGTWQGETDRGFRGLT